ncbi:hypothetical protein PPERSA_12337 [Pseudocohnilembus persalinus]|uniref:Fatty acid desaturase domain-containing protein n=1 Tax=Pseudocohnilembus persalinus TaxID=266149 RepID=A0A0V0R0V6_PSEPJ|nr:hypothetical protein PPERSA_12337 [Pseudocohnilembus persalinus]|eukprot:KRX08182.1 hypothetical protein PPERSA_12337 [Pseudocohnilembus persalinus]
MTKNESEVSQKKQEIQPVPKGITVEKIRNCIPKEYFVKDEKRFLVYVWYSVSAVIFTAFLAQKFIPFELWAIPLWIVYALVNGTIATGIWVLGHECGHHAFSDSNLKNEILGYILHTPLLVPYFSWQHSHHVHHSKCNHMNIGETHVPLRVEDAKAKSYASLKNTIGEDAFAILQMNLMAWLGWPVYLIFGTTGGPARGFTSHFIVPNKLFPKDKLVKVGISNLGLMIVFFALYKWAQATSFLYVFAVYFGPYLIVNCYLVIYTFLQHTDKTIPHYDERQWTWLKGALSTIDRNYPGFINALHYDIGSTHVVHHIFHELPFYNAPFASIYVKELLGDLYNYDSRNIWRTLFECCKLIAVKDDGTGVYRF